MRHIETWYATAWNGLAVATLLLVLFTSCSDNGASQTENSAKPFGIWQNTTASGWMGDGENPGADFVDMSDAWSESYHTPPNCVRISYKPGPQRFAGIYWQNPQDNWGQFPGADFSNRGYSRLVFWARGESGGEVVRFKAGGVDSPGKKYRDSFAATSGKVVLDTMWREYAIDLSDQDLSSVIGYFAWVASASANPDGLTFYIDDFRYE